MEGVHAPADGHRQLHERPAAGAGHRLRYRVKARLFTDGGARGNPGPAASAFVLEAPDGTVLDARGDAIGIATNNVAEYTALLNGLRRAGELGVTELEVVSDSELMVKQMRGEYRVKNEALQGSLARGLEACADARRGHLHGGPSRAQRARRPARERRARRRGGLASSGTSRCEISSSKASPSSLAVGGVAPGGRGAGAVRRRGARSTNDGQSAAGRSRGSSQRTTRDGPGGRCARSVTGVPSGHVVHHPDHPSGARRLRGRVRGSSVRPPGRDRAAVAAARAGLGRGRLRGGGAARRRSRRRHGRARRAGAAAQPPRRARPLGGALGCQV